MYLKASNTSGIRPPWVWVRRILAGRWHIPPWEVDAAPIDEVLTELKLMAIEAEAAQWQQNRR